MDSRIGLDYIVENREYISKLGTALDTSNAVVKKQVFELLSALCAYNADGYARAIETLEFYKVNTSAYVLTHVHTDMTSYHIMLLIRKRQNAHTLICSNPYARSTITCVL